MKKFQLLGGMLIALLVFQFTSCNNEPVLGNGGFPIQDDPNAAEVGQFKAQIDGVEFIASIAEAILTTENVLVLTGTNTLTGQTITLTSEDVVGAEVFNLISGSGTQNAGVYQVGVTAPYTTASAVGGSGQLTIAELNTTDLTVSGTFSIIGKRTQLDANGDPVLDGNGDPIIETVTITPGVFNAIPYVINDTGGGGSGGGGGGDPVDEFYALVDGVEFPDNMIATTVVDVGAEKMVNIVATTASNAKIRIDLPFFLGEGTFSMEPLSDGTKIISLYNSNTGGENLTSNPGTITITEFDTEAGLVIGTFSFTGTDPLGGDPTIVEITEGSFTVNFEGIPGSGSSPFTADVDGSSFVPDSVTVINSVTSGTPVVNIIANSSDNRNLSINFPKDILVGSYLMSSPTSNGNEKIGSYNPDLTATGALPFWSNTGTLDITSYDMVTGDIEGTFSFTAIDPFGISQDIFEITNGQFSVTIP